MRPANPHLSIKLPRNVMWIGEQMGPGYQIVHGCVVDRKLETGCDPWAVNIPSICPKNICIPLGREIPLISKVG